MDEASDAIKKILLNFLQIVSLAGGLPLQWPEELESLFNFFASLSSAGGTLLIPDCEFTHLHASDAFYIKQTVFTFVVPIVVVVCLLSWSIVWYTCRRSCRKCPQKFAHVKNYAVLSVVLMLFLVYPMLVKLCLSMLKCPLIGNHRYLMADLQEKCFVGRHQMYTWMLTVPQIALVVVGLPLIGLGLILRSSREERLTYDFHMRVRKMFWLFWMCVFCGVLCHSSVFNVFVFSYSTVCCIWATAMNVLGGRLSLLAVK